MRTVLGSRSKALLLLRLVVEVLAQVLSVLAGREQVMSAALFVSASPALHSQLRSEVSCVLCSVSHCLYPDTARSIHPQTQIYRLFSISPDPGPLLSSPLVSRIQIPSSMIQARHCCPLLPHQPRRCCSARRTGNGLSASLRWRRVCS